MRTKLEVVGVGFFDMNEDIPISLNYSIADIASPEKRQASFSKTITLPGTKNNNKLFGQIFEVDVYSSFNPNLKTDIILYVDDIENLRGVLRLSNVTNVDKNISYEVNIIGTIGGIYTSIGDDFLTDLDLSAYDHTYNKTNLVASWSATVGAGYVYPMIDYGYNNGVKWNVDHFKPAIYLKQYIDSIFTAAGYTYTSAFFDSTIFKSLIIPYAGGSIRPSEATIDAYKVDVSKSVTQTITSSSVITFPTINSDPASQWGASSLLQVDKSAYWTFDITINTTGVGGLFGIQVWYYAPGGSKYQVIYAYNNPRGAGFPATATFTTQPFRAERYGIFVVRALGAGDVTGGTLVAKMTGEITEGNDIVMTDVIPQKIKQKDLLQSVIRMFNLYVEIDKTKANNLLIEPRDDFYAAGVTIDWTEKLDVDKGLNINTVGNINASRYLWQYKPDSDYYNKNYEDTYKEVYGTRTIETLNDFVKGESVTDVIFSPTILTEDDDLGRIISIISKDKLEQIVDKQPTFNIRLLYYGGLINQGLDWTLLEDGKTKTIYGTYPYAGHLDNPFNSTFDLSFGMPKQVYYDATAWGYTSNNLFNKYHKLYLEDIIDVNSKIVSGYFELTPVDIYKLDFRNQFYVDGHLLRLNKITDYNPINPSLCKCEFLKVRVKPSFVGALASSSGGFNLPIADTGITRTG